MNLHAIHGALQNEVMWTSEAREGSNPAQGCNILILGWYDISIHPHEHGKTCEYETTLPGFPQLTKCGYTLQALHCWKNSVRVSDISRTPLVHIQRKVGP